MPRAVVYARQSLDRSGEGAAIQRQVDDCTKLAEARGWTVVEVITDNDVSASSGKRRPGYERVMRMVESGSVDRIVVWAVDRLTRRVRDLEDVVDLCERTGVSVATVAGDMDLSTDVGRLVARILASVARGEVERKGTRQRRANLQRAQRGDVGWTRRPFGYDRVDGSVVVVEAEAAALKWAAEHVLTGGTVAAAVREFDSRSLVTTAGKPWNVTSLRRALLNPRYSGRAVSRGEDHGVGQWTPILTGEAQERVADVLSDPARRTQQGTVIKHLLSGIAQCGRCGGTLFGSPMTNGGRRWQAYRCRACYLARRSDLVDEVAVGVVLARLSLPDARALFSPDVDVDALRSEAVSLRRRRDELADLLSEGLLSASKVRERATVLGGKLRDVEFRLGAAQEDGSLSSLIEADDIENTWKGMDIRSRRDVINALMTVTVLPAGKGIRWDPRQVSVSWKEGS